MSGGLSIALRDGRLAIEIDRVDRANTLSGGVVVQLLDRLGRVADEDEVRVVTIRGAGDRVFCGGFDLEELEAGGGAPGLDSLMKLVRSLPVPTIALVNGHAVGAGLELASSCDLRIGVRGARLGMPTLGLGVPYRPDGIASILAAAPRAGRMLLTGERFEVDAVPGFADALVDPGDLEPTAEQWCASIASAPRALVSYTVELVRLARSGALDGAAEERFLARRAALMSGGGFTRSVAAARVRLTGAEDSEAEGGQ